MTPNDRRLMNLGLLISVIAILGAAVAGSDASEEGVGEGENGEVEPVDWTTSESGDLNEGQTDEYAFAPDDRDAVVLETEFVLTWQDEDDLGGVGVFQNEGDEFNLTVTTPAGRCYSETVRNEHGQQGEIVICIGPEQDLEWQGAWTVTVTLEDAGDQQPLIGPSISDNSNTYELDVRLTYRPVD